MKSPDSEKCEIDYFVAENDKTSIEIVDEKGDNVIKNLMPSQTVSGSNVLQFGDGVTEGKYQLRLSVGSKTEKLAVWLH